MNVTILGIELDVLLIVCVNSTFGTVADHQSTIHTDAEPKQPYTILWEGLRYIVLMYEVWF